MLPASATLRPSTLSSAPILTCPTMLPSVPPSTYLLSSVTHQSSFVTLPCCCRSSHVTLPSRHRRFLPVTIDLPSLPSIFPRYHRPTLGPGGPRFQPSGDRGRGGSRQSRTRTETVTDQLCGHWSFMLDVRSAVLWRPRQLTVTDITAGRSSEAVGPLRLHTGAVCHERSVTGLHGMKGVFLC